MKYYEFGPKELKPIVLLHGGGLSWWNYREVAELLQDEYHIIIPILDGHSGSDKFFTTIEDNALEIISFIDEFYNGSVLLIGGLSLGAQIVLEIVSKRKSIASYALIESAAVIPQRITHALIGPTFGMSYGLIKNERFARKQFKSLKIKDELFDDYYRDTCQISKKDMIAFMKASTSYTLKKELADTDSKVYVFIGGKETSVIKKSAKAITQILPNCHYQVLEGSYHGEFSINHASEFTETIRQIINQ